MSRTIVSLSALFATLAIGSVALAATAAPDRRAPKFGGLESATQCFPGALRPHEKRPVSLSWDAATPSSGIVYEISMAKRPGRENFAQPNWKTHKLSFTTPMLPPGRYFVVRARNRGGKEDHNTVEKQAQNPCV